MPDQLEEPPFLDEEDDPWTLNVPGDNPVWITGRLHRIPLAEIEDDHLRRIERWLLGRSGWVGSDGAESPARQALYAHGWYDVIRDELNRRGLDVLPEIGPTAPQSSPDRLQGAGA